jgi:hypothetical protein
MNRATTSFPVPDSPCRRVRNVIDYTRSHVATETEAQEILGQRSAGRARSRSGLGKEERSSAFTGRPF